MQLERLIAALAPTDVVGDGALEIRELAYDAREVPRDSLFFCVPGARLDGHDLAAEAVAAGAIALVVERRLRRSSSSATRRPSSRSPRSPGRTARRRPRFSSGRSWPRPAVSPACSRTS